MSLGELITKFGADTTELDSALRGAEGRMKDTGRKMKKIGKDLSTFVSLPLAGIGAAAFKMSQDFETSMSKITGLVGVAQEQVNAWGQDIIEMAPQLGKSPQELADALFFVTSAGLRGAEAMEVLEMSAKASAAGLGETKVVADLVTSAMNAYGSENLNAAQATDILVAAVREGKAEAPQLAEAMGQVLPLASELGVTFDQVGAATAAMTRTGTDASTAAIQLRQILASLLKPTSQSEEALNAMGTSAKELRSTMSEDGLIATLSRLKNLQNEYGDDTLAKVFPNIRALSGVLDIMGSNAESNIAIFESLADSTGALNTAFDAAAETAEFKWNQSISQGKAALVSLGGSVQTAFIPVLESLTDKLQAVTDWFNGLTDAQQQMIVKVGAVVTAVGPLTLALGFITQNVLPGLIKMVRGAIQAFNVLRAVILANPYAALATLIVGATAAIVAFIRRSKEASAAQKELNAVEVEAKKAVADERVELEKLLRIAEDERASKEQRRQAIQRINEIMPDHIDNIDEEAIKTGEAKEAIDSYIESLMEKARLQAAEERLVELEKERIEALSTGADEQRSTWQKITGVITSAQGIMSSQEIKRAQMAKNASEAEKEYQERKEALLGVIKEQTLANSNLNEEISNKPDPKPTVTPEETEEVKKQVKAYKDLNDELAKMDIENLQVPSLGLNIDEQIRSTDAMRNMRNQLRALHNESLLFGDIVNVNAEKQRILQSTIQSLLSQGYDPTNQVLQELTQRYNDLNNAQKETSEGGKEVMTVMQDFASQAASTINQALADTASQFVALTAEMVITGKSTRGIWAPLLTTLADMLKRLGEMAIATGIAVEGIKRALQSLNPVAAIAAGAALIALSVAVKSAAANLASGGGDGNVNTYNPRNATPTAGAPQGLATGGEVVRAGAFKVGEEGEETVVLPGRAKVLPNNGGGDNIGEEILTRLSGQYIEIVRKRWLKEKGRTG
jgi:TP901 family phage tail tape measure protein